MISGFLLLLLSLNSHASTYSGLGAESLSKETIQKFAAQDLEPSIRERIQNLLDVRSPGMGMLHPNKKNLYFTWRITGSNQVWMVEGPKSFPKQMTGGEHPTSIVDITPDGKFLVVSRDRNGEENPGIYLQPAQGGPLKVIQHNPKVQTFHQFTTPDSKFIYFRANQEDPSSFFIYRYQLSDGAVEKIYADKGYWAIADFDGPRLLLVKYLSNTASEYYEYDVTTKIKTPVVGQGELVDYEVRLGRKKGEYLVTTNKFGDFKRVYLFDLKNWKPISPEENFDFGGSIDQKRKRIFISKNQQGYSKLQVLDSKTLKTLKVPEFKGADQVYLGTTSKDGEVAVIGVETAKAPRTSYTYDFKTGKLLQWVVPSAPEVDTNKFIAAELIQIPTRDGKSIPAFISIPEACKQKLCPVVAHFHGGPEAQSTPGFSVFAQMFLDQEMIFVEPNVRGSDGYGKSYIDSDNGPKRLEVITDIPDTADFLKKKFTRDGQVPKVGIMGWSYGGYSTLYAMTRFAGTFDAGVGLVGMSDLSTFLKNTAPYRRALRISEYGDPEKDADALKKLSPITYVDQVKSPLLIIQGVTDPRVPAGEAVQIYEKLKKKNVPAGLILFADEGHGSQKRGNQVLELGHTIAWFKTYLK